MNSADILKICLGALLGLLISTLQHIIDSRRRRKKAEKILSIELMKVESGISHLVKASEKFRMIPTTSLPTLNHVGIEELILFPLNLGGQVYNLQADLLRLEESRQIAAEHLEHQDSQEFRLHSIVYSEGIVDVLQVVEKIRRRLNKKKLLQSII